MSGLCGAAWWEGPPVSEEALEAMVGAVPYRATGGLGIQRGLQASLAQLLRAGSPGTEGGVKVAVSPGEEVWAVADARWDGLQELATALGSEGFRPPGKRAGAAEWALAAYGAWGRECVEHLRGDFALVVWDGRRRGLFAARDLMGMRTLVWRGEPGRVWVATEPKQIRRVVPEADRVDERTVAAYLAGRELPLTWTYWQGIEQLAPGGALWADEGGVRTWQWGTLLPERELRYRDESEYVAHFRELFAEAVRERTRDGTSTGLMLSGGLDSGAVATVAGELAAREEGEGPRLRTYQWAFEGMPDCDERPVSRRVAERWDLPQVDVPVEGAWPLAGGLRHGPDPDEPFAGVYQALIDRTLARAAEDGCLRVLSGDRGDLLMGEYVYDLPSLLLSGRWHQLWAELRHLSELRGSGLFEEVQRQLLRPARQALWPPELSGPCRDAVRQLWQALRPSDRSSFPWVETRLLREVPAPATVPFEARRAAAQRALRGRARIARYRAITSPYQMRVMTWSERSWAQHGLEFTDAWSETRLARYTLAVPQRVLNRVGEDKRLVRRALSNNGLGKDTIRKMRKVSPAPLLYRGLRQEEPSRMEKLLTDMDAARRGWVDEAAMQSHYAEIRAGSRMHPDFWSAISVEMWLRTLEREYGARKVVRPSPAHQSVKGDATVSVPGTPA